MGERCGVKGCRGQVANNLKMGLWRIGVCADHMAQAGVLLKSRANYAKLVAALDLDSQKGRVGDERVDLGEIALRRRRIKKTEQRRKREFGVK